jgi:CRP-like cAMP-binding protein
MGSSNTPYPAPGVLRAPWDGVLTSGSASSFFTAGDAIVSDGDGDAIALIQTGMVRVFVRTHEGRQATVGYAKPGDVIRLPPARGGCFHVAAVRHTTASVLMRNQLTSDSPLDNQHLVELEWRLATWAYDAAVRLAAGALESMPARIAQHILELAVRAPDGRVIAHVSHQGLADSLGTVREVITRHLRMLREAGVIETTPGHVVVVNEELLGAIAAGATSQV